MIQEEQIQENQPEEQAINGVSDVVELGEADVNYKKAFLNQVFSLGIQIITLIKKLFTRNGLIISVSFYFFIKIVYSLLDRAYSYSKATETALILGQIAFVIGAFAGGVVTIAGIWMGRNYLKNRQDEYMNRGIQPQPLFRPRFQPNQPVSPMQPPVMEGEK